jgi:hypothetical protein
MDQTMNIKYGAEYLRSVDFDLTKGEPRAIFGGALRDLQPTRCLPVHVLTFIKDRLYLASYTVPPTSDTVFPYPAQQTRSPSKRSARAGNGPSAASSEKEQIPPYYFSVDDTLLYNAFHHDFGPLHIGHLYRFAVHFHDILGAPENKGKPVVFWSKADARSMLYAPRFIECDPNINRPCQRSMSLGLLHGAHPGLATTSCARAYRTGGSALDAIPRCRLQSG